MKLMAGLGLILLIVVVAGCSSGRPPAEVAASNPPAENPADETVGEEPSPLPEYEIISLLPRDAIPAVFDPEFLDADEADSQYEPDELVLGVEIDGDARAYSIPYLSGREIVNDVVAGVPIAVTW